MNWLTYGVEEIVQREMEEFGGGGGDNFFGRRVDHDLWKKQVLPFYVHVL